MTRKDTRYLIENILDIHCNFTIYSCDTTRVVIKLFSRNDYDNCIKKIKSKNFHLQERLVVKFGSEKENGEKLDNKYYVTFDVPKKYIKETPKTIYDLCGDAEGCFELNEHLRNL